MAGSPDRNRVVLGVHMTAQVAALAAAALVLTVLIGLAVLTWLERTA